MGLGLYLLIQLFFAGLCTFHAWLSWELFRRDPKKGLLAFLIPPLAPYHGLNLKIPKLPIWWLGCGGPYLLLVLFSLVIPDGT